MIDNGVANQSDFDRIWAALREDIAAAIAFAEDSPYPSSDQVLVDVYTKGA